MNIHEKYMRRCIELAYNGLGNTYPNPMVGAVIVYKGKIIGEGYHHKAGEPHAEVNAINSVKNKELLSESTMYVSLEPCSHFGRTPPCSELIINKKISKVVIGCKDTFSKVSGKGIKMLEDSGVETIVGVLNDECRKVNKRFFTFHEKKRPYIILKWAQTADGYIDIVRDKEKYGEPTMITGELALKNVHKQRALEQAILVGTKTVEKDNPSLTLRKWVGKTPLRIFIDKELSVSEDSNLLDDSTSTLVFTDRDVEKRKNTEFCKIDFSNNIIPQIMNVLYEKNIQSLIIEGGQQTLQSVIDSNVWDEAFVYVGNKMFGEGIEAPKIINSSAKVLNKYNDNTLFLYKNKLKYKFK